MPSNIEWRDVYGYEGKYMVSSEGHVYSCTRPVEMYHGGVTLQQGRLRKPQTDKDGHQRVLLFKDNNCVHAMIHTIVLEAFVEPRPEGHWALHINGDKNDCRVENLRWATPKEVHKHNHPCTGEKNSRAKLTANQVLEIRRKYKAGGTSQRKLGVEYGVSHHTIADIISRKNWGHLPEED